VPVLLLSHQVLGRGGVIPTTNDLPSFLVALAALVATYLLARASWRYLEEPFGRLGRRLTEGGTRSPSANEPRLRQRAGPRTLVASKGSPAGASEYCQEDLGPSVEGFVSHKA
jgi:peptidoglycan/LPS O-acetylase OafA/YrhL